MTSVPQVLLAGAFGQGNPGDESVLDAFVGALDGCRVLATCHRPAPAPRGYIPVRSADPAAVARAVVGSDLVVATATVFKTLHPVSGRRPLGLLANTLGMAAVARWRGRPVAFAGVGAGDLSAPGAGLLTRAVARHAAYIEARDEESGAALRRAGVKSAIQVGADVVWATLPLPPAPARPPPPLPPPAPPSASAPDLTAAAWRAMDGGPADRAAVADQRSHATATLERVRRLAFARAGRAGPALTDALSL
jgi:polysaccharide pyruvyl transferase WcaK-like protein